MFGQRNQRGLGTVILLLISSCALQACSANPPPETEPPAPSEAPSESAATVGTVDTPAVLPAENASVASVASVASAASVAPVAVSPSEPKPTQRAIEPTSITVTILSRGRGVPERTREVYDQIRTLLKKQQEQGIVTDISVQRIGLEGESLLCAQFRDGAEARATLEKIRKLAADVELLNIVEEPCQPSKEAKS